MSTIGCGGHFQASTFVCPICKSDRYESVFVRRPGRGDELYRTEFLECAGCTVMFRDQKRFRKPAEVVPIKST